MGVNGVLDGVFETVRRELEQAHCSLTKNDLEPSKCWSEFCSCVPCTFKGCATFMGVRWVEPWSFSFFRGGGPMGGENLGRGISTRGQDSILTKEFVFNSSHTGGKRIVVIVSRRRRPSMGGTGTKLIFLGAKRIL